MLQSLTTSKRRVVTSEGTVFFLEFYDSLHVELNGRQEPVALNLGTCNWTVSDAGEVAFFFYHDDEPYLAIVNPARRTRIFQSLRQHRLLDLLLLKDRFIAAIPGYLVVGQRTAEGALSWTGMRAIDCGAEFHFWLDDSNVLCYSKRGSCMRHTYDLTTRQTGAAFWPARLRRILYRAAFSPAYLPDFPENQPITPALALDLLQDAAREHQITDAGLRLFTLLTLLNQLPGAGLEDLFTLVRMDWTMQYGHELDEPFPTMALVQKLFSVSSVQELVPGKLIQPQLMKWSKKFECSAVIGKRSKPINQVSYTDLRIDS